MDPQVERQILRRLQRLERETVRLRLGEVAALAPLDVDLGDSGTPYEDVPALSGYHPASGEIVAALLAGNNPPLVLGEIGTPDAFHEVGSGGSEPGFTSLWQNYSGSAVFKEAGFTKDPFGFVHLRGLVNRGANPLTATAIFTLPAGYRPLKQHAFAQTVTNAYGRIDVQADGVVILIAGTAGPGGASSYASLAGMTFKAEQ